MEREELKRKIEKLISLRKLFLFLGLFLLIGGIVATVVYSILNPIEIDLNGASRDSSYNIYEKLIEQLSDPGYIFITTLTGLMIDAGIVLLILRGALLGTRLRKAVDELRELNSRPKEEIDTSMWR